MRQPDQSACGQLLDTIGLDEVTEEIGSLDLTLMWEPVGWDCLVGQIKLRDAWFLD